MAVFQGFPPEALTFFAGLEADNSRAYWQANKAQWEDKVRGPMVAYLEAFSQEFQPFHIFRPNRDVRFSKDKSPYKTQIGAVSEGKGGEVYYVHLSTWGLFAACGYYMFAKDQLERYRAAVDDERHGPKLEVIIQGLREKGSKVSPGGAEPLKTIPRGYPKEHPRAELLRWKGMIVSEEFGTPPWLYTDEAVGRVEALWRITEPLNAWLGTYVGRTQESSEPAGSWTR
ncbi:MAG: DUF2461 domain-containing protein [Ktedonobacteraceae bacterium]